MSVYKRDDSPYWHYDFQIKRRRFHGSTGVETKRAAEAVERRIREQAAKGELDDAARMPLDVAAARWWDEHGQFLKGGERLEGRIERAVMAVGPGVAIGDITSDVMAKAIQRRRKMTFAKSTAKGAAAYAPSPSTVNRDMIDTLRPILIRARKVWGAQLPEIDWRSLRMKEPKPRPKEFEPGQIDQVLAQVRPHWHDLVRFALRYGCRLSELFFSLDALDVDDPARARVRLRDRKGGDDHVIPLLPEDARMLAARLGRARDARLDTVWFRELKPLKFGPPRIRALTPNGAAIAIRRAMTRSGLRQAKGMRGAHDFRHHAGMTALRATGNIRAAQRLLGHADIKSTMVYAHALEDDVRATLAAMSRNNPEQASPPAEKPDPNQADKPSRSEAS
ncbi:tyrosine-type recombinase/integrase [Pseudomonas sp. ODNR1LW]|nr:tyrosine-type recombinase/integrase [Pseudomonas sp. ODNR1LW]